MTRLDWLLATTTSLVCLTLYALTLCPTVFWYDSAEYATAAATLGIPHPPGYPLYTLIGRLFVLLPVEPALAINIMSATFGALAVFLCWLTVRRIGGGRVGATLAAATLGTGELFWNQSIIAEVYTPALAALLLVLLMLVRGLQRNRTGSLVAAAAIAGLGLGMHLFLATCGLGLALLVWGLGGEVNRLSELRRLASKSDMPRRLKAAALCLVATISGSCIYIYIPLRASMGPRLNFQDPSSWERFAWFITGGNYKNWFLEDYSILERSWLVAGEFYEQFLVVGLGLAVWGLLHLLKNSSHLALSLSLMAAGNVYFFFNYRVHDVEVFFLPAMVVCCILIGMGGHALVTCLSESMLGERHPRVIAFAQIVLLLFPVSLAAANFRAVDLSHYTAAREYGEKLCQQLPQNAMILDMTTPPEWKNSAVFAYYFQMVLQRRPDVKTLHARTPRAVLRLLHRGEKLYMYYPVAQVARLFELRKEGVAYRIVGPPASDRSAHAPE